MKQLTQSVVAALALFILSGQRESRAQNVYSLEPVQVVGQMNGYSTTSSANTTYRRVSLNSGNPADGRGQWALTYLALPGGGDVLNNNMTGGSGNGFLFISGPSTNRFQNKWVFSGIGAAMLDSVNAITAYNSGNDMGLNMSDSGFYTFVFNDVGYTATGARFYVGYTSSAPANVQFLSVSVRNDYSAVVTVRTPGGTSPEEKVFVRYTLGNDFAGNGTSALSQAVAVQGDSIWEAIVPAYNPGTRILFYPFTSTAPLAGLQSWNETDRSLAVLDYDDNAGANYSYTILRKFSVTFSVNMVNSLCAGNPDSVTVTGSAYGLGNWSKGVRLTKQGSTQVYSGLILLDSAEASEYKFRLHRAGNTVWETGIATQSGNRSVTVDRDSVLFTSCFGVTSGSCPSVPGPSLVTFAVYLGYTTPDPDGKIFVMGNFTNPAWQQGALRLTPVPGNPGYYFRTVLMCEGSFEYKFVNGDSSLNASAESYPDAAQRSCLVSNSSGGYNRQYTRINTSQVLLAYTFDSCTPPPAYSHPDSVICLGGSSTIQALNAELWQGNTRLGSGSVTVSPRQTTQYQIRNFAGTQITQLQVRVVDSIQAEIISAATEICGTQGSLQLQGKMGAGWQYRWSRDLSPLTDTSASIQITDEGFYRLRIFNSRGCESFDSLSVGRITLNAGRDTAITCGNTFLFQTTVQTPQAGNFQWAPAVGLSATHVQNPLATVKSGQTYVVTGTFGSCVLQDTVRLDMLKSIQAAFSVNQTSATAPPFDYVFTNQSSPFSGHSFTWVWGDGKTEINNNQTVNKTYLFNGSYDITLIALDGNGCGDTLKKPAYITNSGGINQPDIFLKSVSPTSICDGDSVTLEYELNQVFPVNTLFGLQLSDASGQFSVPMSLLTTTLQQQGTIRVKVYAGATSTGTYALRFIEVNNPGNVSNETDLTIREKFSMFAISGPDPARVNSTAVYQTVSQSNLNYAWQCTGGTILSGSGSNIIQVAWGNATTGLLRVFSATGCSDISEKQVTLCTPVSLGEVTGDTLVNKNDEANYQLVTPHSQTINWTVNGGTILSGQGTANIRVRWDIMGQGLLTAYTGNNCLDTATLEVEVGNVGLGSASGATVKLYPQPAADLLLIELPGESNLVCWVTDMTGRRFSVQLAGEDVFRLDMSGWVSGVYGLQIQGKDGIIKTSFVKQ